MMPARLLVLLGCALVAAQPARAQDSQFEIPGLGTPGRWESARARMTAGAFAPFDPTSMVSDAALADIGALTASVVEGATYREVEAGGTQTWLRSTRYPQFSVGGPVSHRLVVGGGYSTYLDMSYDVTTRDSTVLRGVTQPYTDAIASDGGVTDLRLAAGYRVGSRLALGLGFHVLTGSTRMSAMRRFDDTTAYLTVDQTSLVRYSGLGVSGGALLSVTPALSLAAFARSDGPLSAYVADTLVRRSNLPITAGGAVRWLLGAKARLAGSVTWRSWSRTGPNAFDTVNWSAGLELGETRPLRLGVRGGQLPFGAGPSAPTEWGAVLGTGRVVAGGRGLVDLGLERLSRSSGAVQEVAWTLIVGLTVRP